MKAVTVSARPKRARRFMRRAATMVALGSLGTAFIATAPVANAAGVVSGTVYRDANNNGVRDAGEPGVGNIVISAGASSVVTNANGAWAMTLVGNVEVRVVTGWYRSQCNDLNCPVGPGSGQDFAVDSQRIVASVTAEANPVLDAGIVPDWQGGYPIPSARPLPANTADVSARVSFIAPTGAAAASNCFRTGTAGNRACAIGDQPQFLAQIFNEGTAALTDPSGYLELPAATSFVSLAPSVSPANHPALGAVTLGTFNATTGRLPFTLNGTLPAGGAAMYTATLQVVAGAPLTTTFQTSGSYPNPVGIRITSVTNDVEGDGCAPAATNCQYGQTNKQIAPDNSDTVGFAIVAAPVAVPVETTPPATAAPTTQPPVTQPPVTQPPVTQPPVTQAPVTAAPVAAAVGCGVSAILVPSCGAWLGASTPAKSGNDMSLGLSQYESIAQNSPDILHFYKTGGGGFPTASEKSMAARSGKARSLLLYNWKASGQTWRQIAAGSADSAITSVATSIKAYPYKIFLTISHEPENEFKTTASSGMTPADYVDMYRHVVTKLRSLGVNNAVFVWNVMGYAGWASVLPSFYPGHSYVDWIGYDPYAHDKQKDMAQLVERPNNKGWPGFYTWATRMAPGKPIMLCEWGVDVPNHTNPAGVLENGASILQSRFPMLKALVYWNSSYNTQARLDQTSAKGIAFGKAYAKFAASAYFNATPTNAAP